VNEKENEEQLIREKNEEDSQVNVGKIWDRRKPKKKRVEGREDESERPQNGLFWGRGVPWAGVPDFAYARGALFSWGVNSRDSGH